MCNIDNHFKTPKRKQCSNPDCEELEILYGYCAYCYIKELQRAQELSKNSQLVFKHAARKSYEKILKYLPKDVEEA